MLRPNALPLALILVATPLCRAAETTYDYVGVDQTGGPHDAYWCDVDAMPPTGTNLNSKDEASDAEYIQIASSNDVRWVTQDPGPGDEMFIWSDIAVAENPADVTRIDLRFDIQGDAATDFQIWVLDQTTGLWSQVGAAITAGADADVDFTRSLTVNCSNYVQGGVLTWGCYQTDSSDLVRVDYLEAKITYTIPVPMDLTDVNVGQASTTDVAPGSDDREILRLEFVATGTLSPLVLADLTITSANVADTDLDGVGGGVKLYWTGASAIFSTTTPLGSEQAFAGGATTFSAIGQTLAEGSNYVWVAFDIDAGATLGNTVDARIALATDVVVTGDAAFNLNTPDPVGNRTIAIPTGTGYIWDGGAGTSDWMTPGNWSPDGVPGTVRGDSATIDTPATVDLANGLPEPMSGLTVIGDGTLVLGGAGFRLDATDGPGLVQVGGPSAGTIVFDDDNADGSLITLAATTMLVAPNGVVTADGRGYLGDISHSDSTPNPGQGPGGGMGSGANNEGGNGGSHGGVGGRGDSNPAPNSQIYGSLTAPVDLGSGGGANDNLEFGGGDGGGRIRLDVAGTLTVDGLVSADGIAGGLKAGFPDSEDGGGAGGSVWITAGNLAGGGSIRADGGDGGNGGGQSGGGGGGGRVAVYVDSSTFVGPITATGGQSGFDNTPAQTSENGTDGSVIAPAADSLIAVQFPTDGGDGSGVFVWTGFPLPPGGSFVITVDDDIHLGDGEPTANHPETGDPPQSVNTLLEIVPVGGLNDGTTYYWQVVAKDAGGVVVAGSAMRSFVKRTVDYAGTVYQSDRATPVTGVPMNVGLLVDGLLQDSRPVNVATGDFLLTPANLTPGATVTIFIDGHGTNKAALVTESPGATAIAGLDLYLDHLVVDNHNGASTSNARLDQGHDGRADLTALYADGGGTTFASALLKTVYVTGNYFPGGDVRIQGTLDVAPTGAVRVASSSLFRLSRSSPVFPPDRHEIDGLLEIEGGTGVPTRFRLGDHQQLVVDGTIRTTPGGAWSFAAGNYVQFENDSVAGTGYSIHCRNGSTVALHYVRFDDLYGRSDAAEIDEAGIESALTLSTPLAGLQAFRVIWFGSCVDGGNGGPNSRHPRALHLLGDLDGDGLPSGDISFDGAGSLLVFRNCRFDDNGLPSQSNVEKRASTQTVTFVNSGGALGGVGPGEANDMDGDRPGAPVGDTGIDDIVFGTSPTAVELVDWRARSFDGEVLLEWATGQEVENLGFNVYRSRDPAHGFERINDGLLVGLGDSTTGGRYALLDRRVENGVAYYYLLEDIDRSGPGPCTDRSGPPPRPERAGRRSNRAPTSPARPAIAHRLRPRPSTRRPRSRPPRRPTGAIGCSALRRPGRGSASWPTTPTAPSSRSSRRRRP